MKHRVLPASRNAPGAPGAAGRSQVRRAPAGGRSAIFVGLLLWVFIITLCVRWDWLDPNAVSAQVVVGQSYAVNPNIRIIKLTLLFLATVVVMRNFSMSMLVMQNLNRGFLSFLIIVPVSVLWSISPGDTLTRFMAVVSVVMLSLACCVSNWNQRRFQYVLLPLTSLLVVSSLLVGLAMPDWITEQEEALKGAWHGLVESKNQFGPLTGFTAILWAHAWLFGGAKSWFALPMLAVSITCLLLSHSSTSLLACLFSLLFMLLMHGLPASARRYLPYLVGLFASVVLIYGLAVLQLLPGLDLLFSPIAALTGKDTTFTNRAEIWMIIKEHIALSPFIGTGYGAYWIGPNPNSPSFSFIGRMYFYPFESHNGYLEIVNDLGYLGLSILLGYLWIYIRQCLELLRTYRGEAVLLLCVFFQNALLNLSESTWLNASVPFSFTVMTLATFVLARLRIQQTLERRRRPAPARP